MRVTRPAPLIKTVKTGLCLRSQACLRWATIPMAPKLSDNSANVAGSGTKAATSPSRTATAYPKRVLAPKSWLPLNVFRP